MLILDAEYELGCIECGDSVTMGNARLYELVYILWRECGPIYITTACVVNIVFNVEEYKREKRKGHICHPLKGLRDYQCLVSIASESVPNDK
jgi:hypothetical protein